MGGKLGVAGGGYANEGGIDRWYTDKTFNPGRVAISSNSSLRTYQNQTLKSILEWALISVNFDTIHRLTLSQHMSAEWEEQEVKRLVLGSYSWSLENVTAAKERMESSFFHNAADPYTLFGVPELSATDLLDMIQRDALEVTTAKDTTVFNPWRAPGSAPIESPCGVFGGNYHGCPGVGENPVYYPFGDCPGGGSSYGPKGETINYPNLTEAQWEPGATIEVGWSVSANHGGGYSYRLCKIPEGGKMALTEECFQQTPLAFVGNQSWIQYGNNASDRVAISAVRTSEGTTPARSEWTKNPVPACQGASGGLGRASLYGNNTEGSCAPQFQPQVPGLFGFGIHEFPKFMIIDLVRVPEDLLPGKYVLSHRWDCEQTPQVWSTCSDVRIVGLV
jgi:hypothetical protein